MPVSRKHLLKNGCSFLDEEGREGTANRDLSLAQLPGPVGTSKAVTDQGNPTVLGTTFRTPYLVAKHQEGPTGLLKKKVGPPNFLVGIHDRDPLPHASPFTLTSLEHGNVYEAMRLAQSFEKDGGRKVYRGSL